jgi:starch-binding outer membrane protein, SusD/RagB family
MRFNKIFTVTALTSTMLFAACSDVIEVEPIFQKDGSQIYKNLDDYQFALTGSYALMRQVGYFGSGGQTTSTWANLPDMMADNLVQTTEDLANWQPQVDWTFNTAESDVEIAWTAAYGVIAQANLTLRGIDAFTSVDAARVNRIKGQALAIRAMAHFDLLRFFGEEYDRNSTKKGIPYVTEVNIELRPARLTVRETWDRIFVDMLAAETALASVTGINTATNKSNLDVTAVRGLLARMYLYSKEYASAESYATTVINAVPLASRTNFPNIWKDASVAEVIWSVAFNAGEGSPATGVHAGANNRNRFRPEPALEATFDQVNDVRFSSYFASRALGTNNRRILTKYLGRGTAVDNLVNWKALRTGEMYLIRAEARVRQGGVKEVQGLADLNDLRAARITGYVPEVLVGTALLNAIELERRKELVGEGHRWFDLKRTSKTINRTAGIASTQLNLASGSRYWTWPIPQAEIDANPSIAGQQTELW